MTTQIYYFASLADLLKKSEDSAEVLNKTPKAVWQMLNPSVDMPNNTMCAADYEYIDLEQPIEKANELAFFPPVTGG